MKVLFLIIVLMCGISGLFAESYVVQHGDTLYRLSKKFSVSTDEIMAMNGMNSPSELKEGMRIVVKKSSAVVGSRNTYTVQAGDTYYSIARNNNIKLDELFKINNMSESAVLNVGQVLSLLPQSKPVTNSSVKVVKKDTPKAKKSSSKFLVATQKKPQQNLPVSGSWSKLDGKLQGLQIEHPNEKIIRSVKEGRVTWVGSYRGFGQVVIVSSGDLQYIYGGSSDLYVNKGDKIEIGNPIGGVNSNNPTVYFAIYKNGLPIANMDSAI